MPVSRALIACAALLLAATSPLAARQVVVDIGPEDLTQIAENRRNPGNMAVSVGGDFNGDGIGDIAIGSPRSAGFLSDDSGNVFIIFGFSHLAPPNAIDPDETYIDLTASPAATSNPTNSLLAVEATRGAQIMPERGGEAFGTSLAAGDFDGDGITDLAIGAPAPFGGTSNGAIYVLYGSPDLGGLHEIDVEIFNDRAFTVTGLPFAPRFGETLAFGDLNGDGWDDLTVSSRGPNNEGYLYIMYGRDRNPFFPSWKMNRRSVDDVVLLTQVFSDVNGERLGYSMATGDVTGNGRDELILGAPFWPTVLQSRGRVAVLEGMRPEIPFYNLVNNDPYLEANGGEDLMQLGTSVAFGRDLLGPGGHAYAFGAPGAGTPVESGHVYIVETASVPTTATISLPLQADTTIRGVTGEGHLGQSLAVGAWDSIPGLDLAIGEPGWEPDLLMVDAGRAYVFTGATLPGGVIDATNPVFDSTRFEGFPAGVRAGTYVGFTDFDAFNTAGSTEDLIIATSGLATYDVACTQPNDIGSWTICHLQRVGLRVYIVRSGSVPDPGMPLSADGAWLLVP